MVLNTGAGPGVLPLPLRRAVRRHLPVLTWLPQYSPADAAGDALAGFTVGLTLIPQAIAYAALAGLPPQYGLYSALPGGLVYVLLGTCKEISIQLTALVALLTATYTRDTSPDVAVLLCFLAGCVQLVCGICRFGFLVDFISAPVVQGFTAAAAVTISCSQIKGMLGLSFSAQGFVDTWDKLRLHIHETRVGDTVLSVMCIIVLLSLRKLKDVRVAEPPNSSSPSRRTVVLRRALWLLATGRNALVVLAAAGITAGLRYYGLQPFVLSGSVEPGLPDVRPPPFESHWGNHTVNAMEMIQHLGAGLAVVPVICILGNVAVAKAFARGRVVDASQEMLALGVCNIVASFFRCAPVSGSFTCSAVSKASGVRSPLAAFYSAALVALALSLLTQYFVFIPRAALSAVVVSAVMFMADVRSIVPMWRAARPDLLPLFATFVAALALDVAPGLLVGVATDMALLLFFTARPSVSATIEQWEGGTYVIVTPAAGLSFPCADHVRAAVVSAATPEDGDAELASVEAGPASRTGRPSAVVLDLAHVARADFSAAVGLSALAAEMRACRIPLMLLNARPAVAAAVAAAASPDEPPPAARCLNDLLQILRSVTSDAEVSKL